MTKQPLRPTPEETPREKPAPSLERDPRINPNLMWILGAALLFLVGTGIYVSMTRTHEGDRQTAQPAATDSSVAGARNPSYQSGQSGPGSADTTGRQSTTGEQTRGR